MTRELLTRDPGVARAWALAAAVAATRVPAHGAEAEAWTVRGWAEVALGCAILGVPRAFDGLDEIVTGAGIRYGGPAAARLRALRATHGPVPGGYPRSSRGPVDAVSPDVWRLCAHLAEFCDAVAVGGGGGSRTRDSAAAHLRWGERYRPSPRQGHLLLRVSSRHAGTAWRTWMRLPGRDGPVAVLADIPRRAPEGQRCVWRGIHDGAHLDHLGAVGDGPSVEFGAGLLDAEAYAMAVEILALVECAGNGEHVAARWLRRGLLERIGRLPGFAATPLAGARPALEEALGFSSPELEVLPCLAAAYVTGPLGLLAGTAPDSALPPSLRAALLARWRTACAASPAAARLTERARESAPATARRPASTPLR
ncbi:hypothetical protein [Streptosporangium sp. NPDC051022]|uniref:hypothetical protein n=1 Tax=Streptosporangium sp. NPDC051022 TaxID=3155752 RepID=UPI003428AC3D